MHMELFKLVVMFFRMSNLLATFQGIMNCNDKLVKMTSLTHSMFMREQRELDEVPC